MENEIVFDDFKISSDKILLQKEVIHTFLSQESHWAKGIIMDLVERSISNSICFGVYHLTTQTLPAGRQVGFARVITDKATFAYLADVFIIDSFRGQGLSKKLISFILSYPELQNLRAWLLATSKAHGLYEKFGWERMTGDLQNNYMRKQMIQSYEAR